MLYSIWALLTLLLVSPSIEKAKELLVIVHNGYLGKSIRLYWYYISIDAVDKAKEIIQKLNHNTIIRQIINHSKLVEDLPVVVAYDNKYRPIWYLSKRKAYTQTIIDKDGNEVKVTIPPVYQRPQLFPEVLEMVWNIIEKGKNIGQSVGINWTDKKGRKRYNTIVLKPEEKITVKSREYMLIASGKNKTFYWPTDVPIPSELKPWIESKNIQSKNDFVAGLKRHGHTEYIKDIDITVQEEHQFDLGAVVLPREVVKQLSKRFGFDVNLSQITIWFEDGTFFKGTVESDEFSKMPVGYYGGLKSAISKYDGKNKVKALKIGARAIRMNVLSNYRVQPWEATANHQQFTYTGNKMPVVVEPVNNELLAKICLGEPGITMQAQQEFLSNISRALHKFNVSGYAGQIGAYCDTSSANFIIFTSDRKLKNQIKEFTFLWSPFLPVHTDLMKVLVKFMYKPDYDGVICLNTNEQNMEWIDRWFIQYAGRDCDGDGIVITDDPRIISLAKNVPEIQWYNTVQFKGETPVDCTNSHLALMMSYSNIILHSGIVGTFDNFARRIITERPALMTWELRVRLTKIIQMGISSVKKHVDDEDLNNPFIIYKILGLDYKTNEWLRKSTIDFKKEVVEVVKKLNGTVQKLMFIKEGQDPEVFKLEITELYQNLHEKLDKIELADPKAVKAFTSAVEAAQEFTCERSAYFNMKNIGKSLLAEAKAVDILAAEILLAEIKDLWYRKDDESQSIAEEIGLDFNEIKDLIEYQIETSEIEPRALFGVLLSNLSSRFLTSIISMEQMLQLDRLSGQNMYCSYSIPVKNNTLHVGQRLTFGQLSARVPMSQLLAEMPICDYLIKDIKQAQYYNWASKTGNIQQSNYLLKLVPVLDNN